MPITILKEDTIHSLPPVGRDIYYWDSRTRGFGVRVFYNGARVYVVRYKNDHGTQSLKTLGNIDEISLQSARNKAHKKKTSNIPTTDKNNQRFKRHYEKRPGKEMQCGYTQDGVHSFISKREDAKYCCREHYHLDSRTSNYYNKKPSPMKSYAPYNPNPTPEVIYLPDETKQSSYASEDIALLQHQLDEMEHRIDQLVEDKVEQKLQQMAETLVGNLFALFTKGDK